MCFFLFRICLDEHPKSLPVPPSDKELFPRKKHRQMDRLRRTLSFRSRKKGNTSNNNNNNNHASTPITASLAKNGSAATTTAAAAAATTTTTTTTTSATTTTADSKPSQWQDDEKSVRVGACNFNVKVKRTSREIC